MRQPANRELARQKPLSIVHYLPIIGLAVLAVLVIVCKHSGYFDSVETLQQFISQFGASAVIVFFSLQVLQPIFPILPGGLLSIVGMLMFGNIRGIIYSCIALIIGELILFIICRTYGKRVAAFILPEKGYQKFELLMEKHQKSIRKLLIFSFIVPFMPDDIVCMIAGVGKMSLKEYAVIITVLKPWSLVSYGYVMVYLLQLTHYF